MTEMALGLAEMVFRAARMYEHESQILRHGLAGVSFHAFIPLQYPGLNFMVLADRKAV